MPGGLVQLLTIGLQDAPLIINPEITFFKTIYRKHTNFALEQIIKSIGTKKFNTFHQFKIPNVVDLLGGFHFIIDIPYFDIIKTVTTTTNNNIIYDINELSILYSNTKTYLFFEKMSQKYYLIPETYFNLSENDNNYIQISGFTLEKNLLANLNLLGVNNYDIQVNVFQLKESKLNQLLPALRLNFNQWYEFWLKIFNNNQNFIYFTNTVSQLNLINNLYNKFSLILYDGYVNYNIFSKFRDYLNFKDEVQNYTNNDINKIGLIYDTDYSTKYANNLNLSTITCGLNALQFNSLFYLFILQSLYPDFTNQIKGYTFWKKYTTGINNIVNTSVVNGSFNYFLEWKSKLNIYQNTSLGNTYESLPLEINDKYQTNYFGTEKNIIQLFNTLTITNIEQTWCILKTFYNQFVDNSSNIICFDDHFNPNSTTLGLNYNIQNYFDNIYTTLLTNSNLNSSWSNFDDPLYIQPVDLGLIYPYLGYKLTDAVVNEQLFDNYQFFVLWRNKLTIAFFYRLGENLDNYYSEKNDNNTFQNTFLDLNDISQKTKQLSFYYNINQNRKLKLDNIREEMNKIFNTESFYGSININTRDLSSNYIFPANSYQEVGKVSYKIANQNLSVTDQLSCVYTLNSQVLTINNWNKTIYDVIFIETVNGFLQVFNFNFVNNSLIINLPNNLNLGNNNLIILKLTKNILIPILDFVPIIDTSGNVNYPNISFNSATYTDISYNLIQNKNLPYNKYNIYKVTNNIITTNNIIKEDNKLKIFEFGNLNYNKFYELKVTNLDNTILRYQIRLDIDNSIIPNINLDFTNIINIDLLEMDFNLELISLGVTIINNVIQNVLSGIEKNYYWLIASSDLNNNLLPKKYFLPVKYDGINFRVYGDTLDYTWDLYEISNSLVPNLYPILYHYLNTDNSGNIINLQLNTHFYQEPFILNTYYNVQVTDLSGNIINKLIYNEEPLYYFYNIPINDKTISMTLNGVNINKIFSINPSEFYNLQGDRYPVVFDTINLKSYIQKDFIISTFNNLFDRTFLNDVNYSNLVSTLENVNTTYENLYLNLINALSNLGQTSKTVINNTIVINNYNLKDYNSFDYNTMSLFTPNYYDLSNNFIINGIGMSKFKISNKGIILTQLKEQYKSNIKITSNLIDYLNTVSQTLLNNVTFINENENLINTLNINNYTESYQPKYILENIINNNFYDISSYKIVTLFDISGTYSNDNTEFYFNDKLIDFSSNNVATGESLISISEKKTYVTEILQNNINDFDNNVFNYLGPIYFLNTSIQFLDTYSLINYYNNIFLWLDDNTIIRLNESIPDNLKVYYNSSEFIVSPPNPIPINNTIYVYQISIDISNNTNITGNSMIIDFNYYNFEIDENNNYILTGSQPLMIKTKYLICGNSNGTIETFTPINFILIKNYHIYKNFKTNIYVENVYNWNIISTISEKLYCDVNEKFYLLDYIIGNSITYYSIVSSTLIFNLYVIYQLYSIPPFTIGNNTINLVNVNKDVFMNTYNVDYFYKLNKNIVNGSNFQNLTISGNFNLWIYPNNKLKLIDTNITVDISSNNIITFSSLTNLTNYSYYYVEGDVHYIEIVSQNYLLDSFIINPYQNKKLYLLDDSNFKERDQQYISIINSNSSEQLLPKLDLTPNTTFDNNAKIYSYYNYDNNISEKVLSNELDLLIGFTDQSNNCFMKPFSFNYDISSNVTQCYVYKNSNNYYNFFFYKNTDVINNVITGNLFTNNFAIDISCNDSRFQIDSSFNFILQDREGYQKYKLLINNGQYYSYIWTLKIDETNINYNNLFNLLNNNNIQYNPINVYNLTSNPEILSLHPDFSLIENSSLVYNNNNNIYFGNISTNSIKQQTYYHSNILCKNIISKLELNYDPSFDYVPELIQIGNKNILNQNFIQINNIDPNLKYLILNNNGTKYFRYVTSVDTFNNIAYLNTGLNEGSYNIYGSSRYLLLIDNPFNIYINNNNYYITNSDKYILRQGDIILFGQNIFEVVGLNSFTLFYDLIPIQITMVNSYYPGFYLLFRLNSTPKIPKSPIVEFKLNNIPNYKLQIDISQNINLVNSGQNLSISEGDNIIIYGKGTKIYNIFNYSININDYVIYETNIYKVVLSKEKTITLINTSTGNLLVFNSEGFYTLYLPYQPCKVQNLTFDSSGNLTNTFNNNLFYYEFNDNFTKSTINESLINTTIFTRTIEFPQIYHYFENKTSLPLVANINGLILSFDEDISIYKFYYNQPIKINSYINYIQYIDASFNITIDRNIFDNEKTVNVYFGKINEIELYSNYQLTKSCFLKPIINLGTYHYYSITNNVLNNYDISQNLSTFNGPIFEDNVLNLDLENNMINLNESYHILLEKNIYNQYISHLCKIQFPNKLFIFSKVEDYSSTFYLDKIYPILLTIDNSFSYKNNQIILQKNIPSLPFNQLIIWRKYDLNIIGLVENLNTGYRVGINVTNIENLIGNVIFYIDKITPCNIIQDTNDGLYYLIINEFPNNFNYLYVQQINYIVTSTKLDYNTIININSNYQKPFGLENIKLSNILTSVSRVDYYYYSLINDFNIFNNIEKYSFATGYVNLLVNSNYYNNVTNRRIIKTSDENIKLDSVYVIDISTNIFNENNIYLDSDASLRNIFNETLFNLEALFNPLKPWNNWSLITNPDINKNVMTQGNLIMDLSKNITRDSTLNYYTKSETNDISGFLYNLNNGDYNYTDTYNNYLNLKVFETKFYENLKYYIKVEEFWKNPITYINNLIKDLNLSFVFDGTQLLLNNKPITNLILNNQYNLVFNFTNYYITRNVNNISQEIYNLVNNNYNNNIYGVSINSVLQSIITLSKQYMNIESIILQFSGNCINYADIILYTLKDQLYNKLTNDQQLQKLKLSLSDTNNYILGLDMIKNKISYDISFNNTLFLQDYPYAPTNELYMINMPFDLNYNIDVSSGLFPYKIALTHETYTDQSIYEIKFLEGDDLFTKISLDYTVVQNNQIEFYAKEDLNISQDFSISSFKTYDVSSYNFIGYVFGLNITSDDIKNLNFNTFTSIKYKNMILTTFKNYLIFPNYIDQLSSYIQLETNVAIESYDISNNSTFIQLLRINQILNVNSLNYTLYLQINNQNYRVDDIYDKTFRIKGIITDTNFQNTKLILTIKPTSVSYYQLLLFNLKLASQLINYSYYFDLVNVIKNFQINDVINCNDLMFIGDNELNILLSTNDVSSNYIINNIVHYAQIGEYPPEPIKNLIKEESYLYQFINTPYVKDISSCFIVYDLSYNLTNSDIYIDNFINNFENETYLSSFDVIKSSNLVQFVCNQFIDPYNLETNTFGGVINIWTVNQYTQLDNTLKFLPANGFIYDSKMSYYINNKLIDSNTIFYNNNDSFLTQGYIQIKANYNLSGEFTFTQLIIEKKIILAQNNQLAEIILADPLDIRYNGYIQTLDTYGNELGDYIYLLNIDLSVNLIINSTINFTSNIITQGKVLLESPLYVISPTLLENVTCIYIEEPALQFKNFTLTLVQYSHIPYTLYKKISLGNYKIFLNSRTLNFLDNFYIPSIKLNKFYLISKFAQLNLEKKYNNQEILPSIELQNINTISTIVTTTTEQCNFKDNLHRLFFNTIDFYIGDQLIEQLNNDVMEIQYQFLKDPSKRKQLDKVVTPYKYNNGIRFILPLEFWFNQQSSLYLPLISLQHTMLSLQLQINTLVNLLTNGPQNSTDTITYKIAKSPEINIDLNIDGILLDTSERELFGNNQHEYIIEIFKTYPNSLIDQKKSTSRMKFKNLIKDIFFITQILSTRKRTYFNTVETSDLFYTDYKLKKALYQQFLATGNFNSNTELVTCSVDFNYLKIAQNDINTNGERYTYFLTSSILSNQNLEFCLYLDSKYQKNLTTLAQRKSNLEVYFSFAYKNKITSTPISPITTLNIQTAGSDIFSPRDSAYFNLVVPYQKYFNSVEQGYYAYSFALYPNDKQPSGHLNFSVIDDIVINTTNNSQVVNDPFILKTTVREYNILRIMSGMGALSWN